jgi:hypothetical protein
MGAQHGMRTRVPCTFFSYDTHSLPNHGPERCDLRIRRILDTEGVATTLLAPHPHAHPHGVITTCSAPARRTHHAVSLEPHAVPASAPRT